MESVYHGLGIGELFGVKIPHAVSSLPTVVDHKDSGSVSVCDDLLGILDDAFLRLIFDESHPVVELGGFIKLAGGVNVLFEGEVGVHCVDVSITQIFAVLIQNHGRIVIALGADNAAVKFDSEGLVAPDVSSLA